MDDSLMQYIYISVDIRLGNCQKEILMPVNSEIIMSNTLHAFIFIVLILLTMSSSKFLTTHHCTVFKYLCSWWLNWVDSSIRCVPQLSFKRSDSQDLPQCNYPFTFHHRLSGASPHPRRPASESGFLNLKLWKECDWLFLMAPPSTLFKKTIFHYCGFCRSRILLYFYTFQHVTLEVMLWNRISICKGNSYKGCSFCIIQFILGSHDI